LLPLFLIAAVHSKTMEESWEFVFLKDINYSFFDDFRTRKQANDCHFSAAGSIVSFYCSDGYLTGNSIEDFKSNLRNYQDFIEDSFSFWNGEDTSPFSTYLGSGLNSLQIQEDIMTAKNENQRNTFSVYVLEDGGAGGQF